MTGDKDDHGKSDARPAPETPPHEGDEVVRATEPPPIPERKPDDLPDLGGKID